MIHYTYIPAEKLDILSKDDEVELVDSQGTVYGTEKILKIAKSYVQTTCGRKWTKEYGEWIACFHGNKAESYPFPSIRRKK